MKMSRCSIDEIDVITKLLHEDATNRERRFNKNAKSLFEELQEIGESCNNEVLLKQSSSAQEDHVKTEKNAIKKNFLKRKVDEFFKLSKVMDDEISVRKQRIIEDRQKIENVQTMLSFAALEKKRMTNIIRMYKRNLESMEKQINEKEIIEKDITKCFNNSLNEKENEIENLMEKNVDLQMKLREMDISNKDMYLQNEELEGEVVIKEEFINNLKLQIEHFEKQHEQDLWKLSQADDLLEMVESEREAEEKYLKEKLLSLINNQQSQQSQQSQSLQQSQCSSNVDDNSIDGTRNFINKRLNKSFDVVSLSNNKLFKSLGWKSLLDLKKEKC